MKKPSHWKMTKKSPIYIYATEMVASYYSLLGLEGKSVLSIVGSGDQIINAYFFGAKEVIGFDINKQALFILDLKFLAIFKLSYREFLKFFGTNMENGQFNFHLYKKIRPGLLKKTKNFFDRLYKEFNNNGRKLIKSEYFHQRSMIKSSASDINAYLKSEGEYLKCRALLKGKKIKFLELDVNDIAADKKLIGKFDIINLSNVLNYLTGNTADGDLLKVLAGVTKKISRRIKKTGIFFYYSYSLAIYNNQTKKVPPASRPKMIKSIKKINNFQVMTKSFKGVNQESFDRINIFSF